MIVGDPQLNSEPWLRSAPTIPKVVLTLDASVREALGETIRPVMPGSVPGAVSPEDETDAEQGASLTSLPQWTGLSINVADT